MTDTAIDDSADGAQGSPEGMMTPRRRYIGDHGRQIHILETGYSNPGERLYCLHATAYSGRSFLPFMQALAVHRHVLAPDTPGYGASDRPERRLDISGYAEVIGQALGQDAGGSIDLLGYHTGALLAVEVARQYPQLVRRVILIGVPFFTGAERDRWRGILAKPTTLTEDIAQFDERWDFFIARRREGVSLTRGFENFVDELRAWPDGWWAHDAAFTFDIAQSLSGVSQPTLVVNPHNHLSAASRQAAALLCKGSILELPSLDNAIFDIGPALLAEVIQRYLSSEKAEDPLPNTHYADIAIKKA